MPRRPSTGRADLEAILERLEAIEARIARLEGDGQAAAAAAADFAVTLPAAAPPAATAPAATRSREGDPQSTAPRATEPVSEEILLVISATVAAFLGERAHVRQVRLLHSDAWAQQGRVSVMASHRWAVHR